NRHQQVHRRDGTQESRPAPGGLTAVSPACVTRRGDPSASKGRILRPVYEGPPTTPGRRVDRRYSPAGGVSSTMAGISSSCGGGGGWGGEGGARVGGAGPGGPAAGARRRPGGGLRGARGGGAGRPAGARGPAAGRPPPAAAGGASSPAR